jgi:hypothetical protein
MKLKSLQVGLLKKQVSKASNMAMLAYMKNKR